jgi:DNA-directed RNA polymerase subunit RPC12/RpoP
MSQPVECPRCHLSGIGADTADGLPQRCPACGSRLVAATGPRESEVRRYMHRHHHLPLRHRREATGSGSR